MKYLFSALIIFSSLLSFGQQVEHIDKLELKRKDKKIFNKGDSSIILKIDTLIMKDKSKLEFYGKKDVIIEVGYAEIGKNVIITGQDGKNNATNFNITAGFLKLESLFILARGIDAFNGTKTFPNGDGGVVTLNYNSNLVKPQTEDKKAKNYVFIDVNPGGLRVNSNSEISQIYSRILMSSPGLRGMPQGQIYSGSPGKEGKSEIKAK